MTTILVIEDELDVREIILDILYEEGYAVHGAENGAIGLQIASEILPDLIICDVMMPKMDGYEVLENLRNNSKTATIPFIFLTAKVTRDDLRQGMNLGADDYLTKPFRRDELLNTISSRMKKQAIAEQKIQEKLEELRGNITLSLPHQLRTPLNGIMGLSQLLIEDFQEMEVDEVQESLVDINTSAKRLYKLVSNFLLYADLELLDHYPERVKSFIEGSIRDQNIIIQDIIKKLLEVYPERTADIIFNNCNNYTLNLSEKIFRKILEELLDNALKFSEAGTPIEIKTDKAEQSYYLEIADQGQGMTAEKIANLEIYQKFDRSRYEQQGLGLGLVIVQRLIKLQGGDFQINSIPKQGTNIKIILPM
ncbi:MAG: hybrid sensor histidine kinase/response regulator [Microcoleaceae cyanobacterium]